MNKCSFIGNLVRDPEIRKTSADVSVVSFSIAVNRPYKRGKERVKETSFLDMEAWDKGAELIAKYFKKGDPIVIDDASVKQESWEDKGTGQKRSRLKFRVNEFSFPPFNSKSKDIGKPEAESEPEPSKGGGDDNGQGTGGEDEIPF